METSVAQRFYFDFKQFYPVKIQDNSLSGFTVGYLKDISATGCALKIPKRRARETYSDLLFADDAYSLCHKVQFQPGNILDYRKQKPQKNLQLTMAPLRTQSLQANSEVVYVRDEGEYYVYGLKFKDIDSSTQSLIQEEVTGALKRNTLPKQSFIHSKILKLMWLVISFTSIITVSKIIERFSL